MEAEREEGASDVICGGGQMEGTGGESPSVIEEAMTAIQETRDSFRHRPDGMAPSMIPRRREGANAESEVVTLAKLAALHARLKTAQLRVHAQKLQWESIVRDVEVMEQVNFNFNILAGPWVSSAAGC